ncbi:MAG TPA: DPP IV N-terminal domain-containing protein, partial [Anaerolineaceae bacterium]|nr:DPP IV N-terminal domain-containing protein [Anaerolineaceae bacterium]
DLDGSNSVQLTENPADFFMPSLSPDGSRIVVEQKYNTEAGYSNLVEICLDGSCFNELTKQKEGVATRSPAWAPFDHWIAYCYNRDLYVIKSDGSIIIRLTQTSYDEAYPAWRVVTEP